MKRRNVYLSTIAQDAPLAARQYGLGLEIAEYCTACNMDEQFAQTDTLLQKKLIGITNRVFHGPFNELFPCAIDPLIRELARYRFRQAIALAQSYGVQKLVLHGGYNPRIYYPCWYTEQSVVFWKDFLQEVPENLQIVLENVLEDEPEMILNIITAVNDPRLQLCLDVGHANAYSQIPATKWLERCASCISHFHIHNNHGDWDAHGALPNGSIQMAPFLKHAQSLCPDATYTLELMECAASLQWLESQSLI